MKNYKNFKRNRNRNNNIRSFKSNVSMKYNGDFNISNDFKRKKISKNINAAKLIEKYTELAKEALSNGDKILSENYFQHADHFIRISEKQGINSEKKTENLAENNFEEKKIIKDINS